MFSITKSHVSCEKFYDAIAFLSSAISFRCALSFGCFVDSQNFHRIFISYLFFPSRQTFFEIQQRRKFDFVPKGRCQSKFEKEFFRLFTFRYFRFVIESATGEIEERSLFSVSEKGCID